MKNKSPLYNVWAVVNSQPFAKINKRRMSREAAQAKVDRLLADGSPRAYAIVDRS